MNHIPGKNRCARLKRRFFIPIFKTEGQCVLVIIGQGETLWDVIVQIGEMIQYQNYNPKSPLDARAAKWARANEHLFPVGKVDLYQPDPEVEIGVEVAASMDDDDLDITLFPSKNNKDLDNLDDIDIEFN